VSTDIPREEQARFAQHWSARWQEQNTPWDMGGETPVFQALRLAGELPMPATQSETGRATRVWFPGCGSGYDVLAWAAEGYDATGVDFAPEPLARMMSLAKEADLPADRVTAMLADVLQPPPTLTDRSFDIAVEYTCYCAIPPDTRETYVNTLAASLRPGGLLLALLFPTDGRDGGPPFAVEPDAVADQLRAHGFRVDRTEVPTTSHPKRRNKECLLHATRLS